MVVTLERLEAFAQTFDERSRERSCKRCDEESLARTPPQRSLSRFHQKATRVAFPPNCDTVDASWHGSH
jgi:hypothetical protein